jgi:hypothetical protein
MSLSTRIIRYLPLALAVAAVAAVAAPGAQAASGSESREAAFTAHWKHEDSMYEADRLASVRSLPASLEAHWNHEDSQYNARSAPSGQPRSAVVPDEGTDRLAVLTAAAGLAVLLILGTVAVIGIRRKHGRLAPS